jgi:hypothetical protein
LGRDLVPCCQPDVQWWCNESMYGNTAAVAESVAEGLARHGDVDALAVDTTAPRR